MKLKYTVLLLLALLAAHTAGAATITVTSTDDNGAGTLRDALTSAANGDTIDATGVSGTILLTSGELLVPNSLSILGPGPSNLAVNGNAASRVFHIGSNTVVSISGLTITNGLASGVFPIGGGIYNSFHATLIVSNCALKGNSVAGDSFTGVVSFGGGMYNAGTVTIANSILSGNLAGGDFGIGGGIYNEGTLAIAKSTLCGNLAFNAEGGGIYNGGMLTIANSTLSSNSTGDVGGGIANFGTLMLAKSTLRDNLAPIGGGIYNGGSVTIVNSTLSGNSAGEFGGGIANGWTLKLANSTLSDNSAPFGGGIYNADWGLFVFGSLEIGNTILKAGASGANIGPAGTVTSLGYNLSSDDGDGLLTNTTDQINTDPMLGTLQDNGGPTFTHALLSGSPAIDRGTNFSASATDQRGAGFTRTFDNLAVPNATGGDGTDIGAFEVQPTDPCSTIVTTTADSGPGSLRSALACAVDGDTIDATGVSGTIVLTSGELLVNKSVAILGPGPNNLTVDGNAASRVMHVGPNTIVSISGLMITRGNATNLSSFGGGIYNDHANLTVRNCAIAGNAGAAGGGIYSDGTGSDNVTTTIIDTQFGTNSAVNGGGIFSSGAPLTVSNSVFSGNSAFNGGAVFYNDYGGDKGLRMIQTMFDGNTAVSGGGLWFLGDAFSVRDCLLARNSASSEGGAIANYGRRAEVSNSTLESNSAYAGGAIYSRSALDFAGAALNVTNSTLSANSALSIGGAIYNDPSTGPVTVRIVASTLCSNSAMIGGGLLSGLANGALCCGPGGTATAEVFNSTLSGNSATLWGGAIYAGGGGNPFGPVTVDAIVRIANSTLAVNTAGIGTAGGIFNDGSAGSATVEIGSTILQAVLSGGNITNHLGSITSLGHNLSSDDGGGFLNDLGDQINTDPMLGPLQDNGGPTFTHALLCSSPAIDKGINFSVSPTDQRGAGFARTFDDPAVANSPFSDGTDIGAVEVQEPCAPQDSDGDGVADAIDQCSDTPPGVIVDANGCSIAQLVPCDGPRSGGKWKNHGQYVWAVVQTAREFRKAGLITRRQWAQIVKQAAHSKCGKKRHSDHDGDQDWHSDRVWDHDNDPGRD